MPLGSFRLNTLSAAVAAGGGGSTFSSIVTTSDTSPFITIYNRVSNTFTKLSNPAWIPTDRTWCADWNKDGTLLAVGGDADGYFNIYSRSGDTFTRLTQPATMPTARVRSLHWHPTLNRLAVASGGKVRIYDVSGSSISYVTVVNGDVSDANYDVAWSPTGNSLAYTADAAGFNLWNVSGNTFTLLTSHPEWTNTGRCVAWNHDGSTLVVGRDSGSFVYIYNRSGDSFTRIASAFVGDGYLYSACFNHDGTLMAISSSGVCKIWSRSGNTFTEVTPASMTTVYPDNSPASISFNDDGTSFAMGSNASPFIHLWNVSGTTFTKLSNPASLPTGRAYTAKFYPGVKG